MSDTTATQSARKRGWHIITNRYNMPCSMSDRISTLGYALIGLIRQHPASGYNLSKTFATTPMAHYSSSPGAIYPALERLQERGLIRGRVEPGKKLKPRRTFTITKRGETALAEWLRAPVTERDVIWGMAVLMLRFSFMGALDDPADTVRFLTEFHRELRAYLRKVEGFGAGMEARMPLHGRLALESGVENLKTTARWAKRAIAAFEIEEACKS